MTRISVLMSVYNGATHVAASLRSVLEQDVAPLEIIVVDDGSTDRTPQILAEVGDARVRVLRQKNRGLTAALNVALVHATGEFIARQDADDLSAPGRLRQQAQFLQDHPEVAFAGSWAAVIDDVGERLGGLRFATAPGEIALAHARENQFVHGALMFRAAALRSVGGYREGFRYAQDYDLTLRMLERFQSANLPLELYRLRHSREKISFRSGTEQKAYANLARRLAELRRSGLPDPLETGAPLSNWLEVGAAPAANYDDVTAYLCLRSGETRKARAALARLMRNRPTDAALYAKWLLTFAGPRFTGALMSRRDRAAAGRAGRR